MDFASEITIDQIVEIGNRNVNNSPTEKMKTWAVEHNPALSGFDSFYLFYLSYRQQQARSVPNLTKLASFRNFRAKLKRRNWDRAQV